MSNASKFAVEIREFAPITVAFVRHIGPYIECEAAFNQLFDWATKERLQMKDGLVLGIPHDDPEVTPPEELRYDACMEIPQSVTVSGNIKKQNIAGGRYACCILKGSYQQLMEVYRTLYHEWLPASGEEPRHAPPIEIYYNSPHDTPEEELLTEVRVPLV